MRVNAVNDVLYKSKRQAQSVKNDKSDYYKWVSQNQANDALKMSVGREVEDGKYKSASMLANLAGTVGTLASLVSLTKISEKAQTAVLTSQTEEQALQFIEKAASKTKKGVIGLYASIGLLLTGTVINMVNVHKANKTANERGFLSQKDMKEIKGNENIYQAADMIYNAHVK